jgi:polyhydroxybutyrate depolymerase
VTLTTRMLRVAGQDRPCLVSVPDSGAAPAPTAIVLSLHGSLSDGEGQRWLSRTDELSAGAGAVVAFPQASTPGRRGFVWDHDDDLDTIDAALHDLRGAFPAAAGRVGIAGMSGGARMACHVAWARPGEIHAVGAVAGLRAPALPPPPVPVPVLAFHGTADRINPYGGGSDARWDESVPDAARHWAEGNGVDVSSPRTATEHALTRTTYGTPGAPDEVTLWTIPGGGHTWPGGRSRPFLRLLLGRTSHAVDATAAFWQFLVDHTPEAA